LDPLGVDLLADLKVRSAKDPTGIARTVTRALHSYVAGGSRLRPVGRTAARTLCNFSLRTASGPEGSSAK